MSKISKQSKMEEINLENILFYNASDVINLAKVDTNKFSITKEDRNFLLTYNGKPFLMTMFLKYQNRPLLRKTYQYSIRSTKWFDSGQLLSYSDIC